MKLYVICGHGAGDSGACGNGFQEAERVRVLGKRIKELGGSNVELGDVNRNFYADNGITYLKIPEDYQIIELHMDSASASARGAHVIIKGGVPADTYDNKLAKFLTSLFPGRASSIVGRNDLANPARAYAMGYSYRLIECGFISNATDVSIFNGNIDYIAKGILECFGLAIQSNETLPTTPTQGTEKYGVGTQVCANKIWTQANGGTLYQGDWKGEITKVISGAEHPYLLNNGTGWTSNEAIDSDPHDPNATSSAVTKYDNWLVDPGDTLGKIAEYFECSVDTLARYNNIANPNVIYVGQVIYKPK